MRGLSYLALRLNRTLILPNVLAETRKVDAEVRRSNKGQRPIYMGNTLWPGFRVLYSKGIGNHKNGQPVLPVPTVEPAYYWRIKRDLTDDLVEEGLGQEEAKAEAHNAVPTPKVVMVTDHDNLADIEVKLKAAAVAGHPRVVVHVVPTGRGKGKGKGKDKDKVPPLNAEERVVEWAQHSVGLYGSYKVEKKVYGTLPAIEQMVKPRAGNPAVNGLANSINANLRLCGSILEPMRGNRSCFDKCN